MSGDGTPSGGSGPKTDRCCLFCLKCYPETGPLVEGAGPDGKGSVFICRNCTELCLQIFEQEEQSRQKKTTQSSD